MVYTCYRVVLLLFTPSKHTPWGKPCECEHNRMTGFGVHMYFTPETQTAATCGPNAVTADHHEGCLSTIQIGTGLL